jgi:toxin ParE1/3/4
MERKLNIEYLTTAIKDLQQIFDYISRELAAPQAAHVLLNKFDESISRLAYYPYSCEKAKDATLHRKGYRMLQLTTILFFMLQQLRRLKLGGFYTKKETILIYCYNQ